MPQVRDFRADFRKGRTGRGMRVRQDTPAYLASLRDAENMMVLPNGVVRRRWGTIFLDQLPGPSRTVGWSYAGSLAFLLSFRDGTLQIYRVEGGPGAVPVLEQSLDGPWTTAVLDFLQVTPTRDALYVTDTSFRSRVIRFDPAGTVGSRFSIRAFRFQGPDKSKRRAQPFVPFSDDTLFTPRVFLSAKTPLGYGAHLATATGYTVGADFSLDTGEGRIDTDRPYFQSGHVGLRLRLLTGEARIVSVQSATRATIEIIEDLVVQLDTNPLWLREGSRLVEVAWPDHGLVAGDQFFLMGLPDKSGDMAGDLLIHTPRMPVSLTGASALGAGGTAQLLTVRKVVDASHFEFNAVGGTLPTNTELGGGSDLYAIPIKGTTRVTEECFSDLRGWPQAATVHENRLWMGGSVSLPDVVIGSVPFDYENFDTGKGSAADAVLMAGIGTRSQIRHLASHLDLLVLHDEGVHYVPALQDSGISQETVRAIPCSNGGASYVPPILMDGGCFYVEAEGSHIREMVKSPDGKVYTDQPLSIVVPDWIKGPFNAAAYVGHGDATMAYGLFAQGDGSLLVMHSSRNDEAFGFMRWTVGNGLKFMSTMPIAGRLFCILRRGFGDLLCEFDTSEAFITTDATEIVTGPSSSVWSPELHDGGGAAQVCIGADAVFHQVYEDYDTPLQLDQSTTRVLVGIAMPFLAEIHPAVVQTANGNLAGQTLRLVSADIHWRRSTTGSVHGWPVASEDDEADQDLDVPAAIDRWETYPIGEWGKDPTLRIEGHEPGHVEIEAVNLKVYF